MLTAQLLFTYLPVMNTLFHTSPIGWIWWGYFSAAGGAVMLVVEAFKATVLRRSIQSSANR